MSWSTLITKTLPYGDSTVEVSLPDRTRSPSRDLRSGLQPVADQAAAVRTALANPLGLPRIREARAPRRPRAHRLRRPDGAVLRPVRRLAIEAILEELARQAVSRRRTSSLVCANALHRKWTHEELARILGEELVGASGRA